MRLIYVTSSLPYGPGEAFIIPEILELMRQGSEVLVVPMRPRGHVVHEEAVGFMASVVACPVACSQVAQGALFQAARWPLRSPRALLRLLGGGRLSVLLKNLAVYPKGLWLAGVALEWKADHIHAHWAAATATAAMIASEVSEIPWSFTAHRWDIVEGNLLAAKAKHASFARFISKSGLELALRQGVLEHRARVLHMGVRLPRARDSKSGVLSRPFRLLCPAALLPVKGHAILIQALADLDGDIELWLAGEGPLRKNLEAQVTELGLQERVRFLGWLRHESLLRLYEECQVDVVVLPSLDLGSGLHEGIPVALMEAMAYGLPVISTTTGGIPELLDGGAGLLVPPQDPNALASAIARFSRHPELRERLGQSGRQRVEQEFAIEKVVERLGQWFCESRTK